MRRRTSNPSPAPSYAEAASSTGDMAALRSLVPYLWPHDSFETKLRVVVALILLVGAKVANVWVPLFYKRAVDALSPGDAGALVTIPLGLIVAYGLARVMSLVFAELRDAVFANVAQRTIRKVALSVFQHLHALSLRFHLERQTGGLTRSLERGTRAIETLLRYALFSIVPTLVEITLVCVILWRMFDGWFALATFVTVGSYIAYTFFVSEWRIQFRRAMNETDNKANTKAVDSLLNYETVKYFGNEGHEARRYDQALASYEQAAVKSQRSLSLLNIGQSAIISLGLAVVMGMAARGIVNGTMTLGDFVLVNTYLLQLYQPLNFFGVVYREIKQALIDVESMVTLLSVDREVADRPGAPPLAITGGELRFDGVEFGYDPRRPILKGVSFTVPAGRTVAIVGPSGAGKSTIGRLLFRFYDVSGGGILIDGQDIREVTQQSLRGAIGIVPQDTVLFNDTVYYNIAYGRPGASPAEVEQAARLAHIHNFIMALPDGYETTVGERGLKLSGGEKQRVAIARTILKNPAILLFDEATSALDTHTEREIQANLREVSRGRTTLVIAHRLSTVIDADEILVMEAGRVIERGRHMELLSRGGAYAALWARQQESSQGPEPVPEVLAPT
ncbi:ABC transporter ATP-binding protein/permease [Azospirillum brasilense]|uniref:ABC transporter ATP-binding protein/permease n=1 Tax=Azospirillum brasilense TaxID=192 RepID=A0A0P0EFP9_AZOBR|nr:MULTISPECIES: ABC transporter ATP-binding protein/permease [Azospirillum]ALJ37881.1 metal ABC transporter permease [Azospirillum brasilense]MDW7554791.1 ABC transporter ATP-binding protein/permease [Azospirillum brasilense]MDW7597130.1 ABC transporter ATP-binding protein/permease [Azospirillum brasilense]MDW7632047.1 ABC transporter ATP-binding protein/permease [Azospirillum brasilense]MDX5951910.1 ABC transporter ATP-binding protein/permease [Azospirillum brasilense]